MEALGYYLLKSSAWLAGFALVYALFLRNERYFFLNRVYLLSGIIASLVFPLWTFHYPVILPVTDISVEAMMPVAQGSVVRQGLQFTPCVALLLLYILGLVYFSWRMIWQTLVVVRVIRKAEVIRFGSVKLIKSADYPSSFSFFSFVFVNPSITDAETEEIVKHEWEHIRQQHWFDLLLTELLSRLLWFNPVVWFYGRYIRQNHEYLADEQALQRTANPAIYRAALLNQMFDGPVVSLANSFNYSLNKKRFNMMKKTNSSPLRKVKILLILPVVAMLFYAFAKPEYVSALPSQPNGGSLINQVNAGKKVTGTVLKPDGTPLPGTSVIVAGTAVGAMADPNGKFELSDVPEGADLSFSFVGYRTQLVKAEIGRPMIINMKRESIGMDQVTVVGYGPMDATTLRAEKINVRGIDSENPPLIILDGKEIDKKQMDGLNPQTIQVISVLKDKNAVEEYGEKAKNGVIVITTKKDNASANPQEPRKTTQIDVSDKPVFVVVEEMPEFPGGQEALMRYIASSIKYPAIAQQNGIQGKVFVKFVIGSNGKVQGAEIARGVDPILDQEALRVVNSLPAWKPGQQRGQAVDVEYVLPVEFKLQ